MKAKFSGVSPVFMPLVLTVFLLVFIISSRLSIDTANIEMIRCGDEEKPESRISDRYALLQLEKKR